MKPTILTLLLAGVAGTSAFAAPRLEPVAGTTIEFGTIPQGESFTHAFRYRNAGDEPLQITDVKSSCGCTTASNYDRSIAPGAESELNVTFNSSHKRGLQVRRVTVMSNDPERPQFEFTLRGSVLEPIAVDPYVFSFRPQPLAKVSRSGTIRNNLEHPIVLGDVVFPDGDTRQSVRVTIEDRVLEPGESSPVVIEFTAPAADRVSKSLHFFAYGPETIRVNFRIVAFVEQPKESATTTPR